MAGMTIDRLCLPYCKAVEAFLRENLPDDRGAADILTAEDDA